MQKFIHITDTHFVPPGNLLYGLNLIDRLAMCIADVNRNHADAVYAIFTGDLAHKGSPRPYEALKRELDNVIPYHLMVGNHDDRANFRAMFPRTPVDADGFIQYAFEMGEGVLGICLDTDLVDGGSGGLGMRRRHLRWENYEDGRYEEANGGRPATTENVEVAGLLLIHRISVVRPFLRSL